jgi:hypothetical protein
MSKEEWLAHWGKKAPVLDPETIDEILELLELK